MDEAGIAIHHDKPSLRAAINAGEETPNLAIAINGRGIHEKPARRVVAKRLYSAGKDTYKMIRQARRAGEDVTAFQQQLKLDLSEAFTSIREDLANGIDFWLN